MIENHPAESEAMQMVSGAIVDGINRPDPLGEKVGTHSEDWTEAQASTIRSGLIGRMYELGLVSWHQVGLRGIGCELTDAGEEYLQTSE